MRRAWGPITLTLASLVLLVTGSAAAQASGAAAAATTRRSGLWAELGLGWGSLRAACAGCEEVTSSAGGVTYFRVGGQVSPHVFLGGETNGFFDASFISSDSTTLAAEIEAVNFIAIWFPGRSGLFLKGGLGIAQGRFTVVDTSSAATETVRGTGVGINVGAGWDFPLRPRMALTASFTTQIVGIGDFVAGGRTIEDVIGTVYQLAVGFVFR